MRDSKSCDRAVEQAVRAMGGLDVLCNIAGVLYYGISSECADEDWERVIGVNLTGTFFMARA
ncbi:MAG: SDR family oxidoreductase, partial [Deltaproteobacteria bacterium]|nr:SDR family oxidoreductase [Deltaproteobacteria bacterium]